jgi:hypothetical protein
MKTKIAAQSKKMNMDENISLASEVSMDDEQTVGNRPNFRKDGAVTQDMVDGDDFFATKDENETAEEKRLRMTKKIIADLGEETKNNEDFFFNL